MNLVERLARCQRYMEDNSVGTVDCADLGGTLGAELAERLHRGGKQKELPTKESPQFAGIFVSALDF